MELDRRRVIAGFWLTLVGFLLAFVVASEIPTPAPPSCGTAICNAAYGSALFGLGLVTVGMTVLAWGLYRGGSAAPGPSAAPPPPGYSFTSGSSPASAPLPAQPTLVPGSPPVRSCPGCGVSVTAEYGFCPRCGRTLAP